MENIDFDSIPATALNCSSHIFLGTRLNPQQQMLSSDGYARDYRGLAELMDFSYDDIKNFESKGDPTQHILREWVLQPNATMGRLVSFLEQIGRHDVKDDFKSHLEKDAAKYLQEMNKYKDSPLQVPEVTSCRSQCSQLDDLNVLTREDALTGGVTIYDAYVSYADEDFTFVYQLVQRLESVGFKLFIRSRDLLAGHSEFEIDMQLIQERCRRVLIVLSPDYLKCPACEVQSSFAAALGYAERRRKIVPILLKHCDIPVTLRFVTKIDFTKPGIQDWIWETLKSSLQDVPAISFIAPPGFPQLMPNSLPEINNPVITYPPTSSYTLSTGDILPSTSSSSANAAQNERSNELLITSAKNSTTGKQKNKLSILFWQNKRPAKKDDSDYSSASISSSNITSGFHSQSENGLESIDILNEECSRDTPV
ncbi:myeloid differentiation primary response protein MyD88 [Caerostris extrusa]|uniref:Myeloid differentiation primary response protein MyD88 n=1 Tax=Caerostris extrusa TaxID=172846 RepID=A0AAV4UW80_CAEEX|nr:myeloid differentiation primary response protein MyD88 [Caerostris extrusa]